MAMTTKKIIRLTFENAAGSTSSITLPEPRADVLPAEIEAAMDLAISKNIYTTTGGDLTGISDIKIIDTTTEDLYSTP